MRIFFPDLFTKPTLIFLAMVMLFVFPHPASAQTVAGLNPANFREQLRQFFQKYDTFEQPSFDFYKPESFRNVGFDNREIGEARAMASRFRDRVRITTDSFELNDEAITITVWPLRPLELSVQTEVTDDLLKFFRVGLVPALRFSAQERKDLLRQPLNIIFGEPVTDLRFTEIEERDMLAAIRGFRRQLKQDGTWNRRFAKVERDLMLEGDIEHMVQLGLSSTGQNGNLKVLTWVVAMKQPGEIQGLPRITPNIRNALKNRYMLPRYQDTANQFIEASSSAMDRHCQQYRGALREFIVGAMSEYAFPDKGSPLLSPEAAGQIKLVVDGVPPREYLRAMTPGQAMSVGPGMQMSSTRAAAGRLFGRLSPTQAVSIDPARPPMVSGPPQARASDPKLAIDTRGFQGGGVASLSFSANGAKLIAAGEVLRIWNTKTGELERTIWPENSQFAGSAFTDAKISPDGQKLVAAVTGQTPSLRVYDLADPSYVAQAITGYSGHIERIAFSEPTTSEAKVILATAGSDRVVRIWDWSTRTVLKAYQFQQPIDHLSVRDPEGVLAITTAGGYAKLPIPSSNPPMMAMDDDPIEWVVSSINKLSSDQMRASTRAIGVSRNSVVFGGGNPSRRVYRCSVVDKFPKRDDLATFSHNYTVTACAVHDYPALAASADATGRIVIWDREKGTLLHEIRGATAPIYSVAFAGDPLVWRFGRTAFGGSDWRFNHYASLGYEFDLRLRRLRSIEEVEPPQAITSSGSLELSVEVDGNDRSLRVEEPGAAPRLLSLPSDFGWKVLWYSFLPIAAPAQPVDGDNSPPSSGIILAMEDGSLTLLDPTTLRPQRSFVGHTDRVWGSHSSPDGRFLISSGSDGILHLWSLQNLEPRFTLAVTLDELGKVSYVFPGTPSADVIRVGDYVDAVDGDHPNIFHKRAPKEAGAKALVDLRRGGKPLQLTVELTNMGDRVEPLLSALVSRDASEWIVWTSSGYYDCSAGAGRLIGWRKNLENRLGVEFISAEDLRAARHRPEVVDLVLQTGNEEQAIQMANEQRANLPPTTQVAVLVAPQRLPKISAKFVEPPQNTFRQVTSAELEVRLRVTTDSDQPPEGSFLINGSPTQARAIVVDEIGATANPGSSAAERSYDIVRSLALTPGRNRITAVVRVGSLERVADSWVWVDFLKPNEQDRKPTLHVLCVGIDQYAANSKVSALKFAGVDAEKLTAALQSQANGLYGDVKTRCLTNQSATKEGIETELGGLLGKVQAGDTVIIHLAMHGVLDKDGDFWIVPHNGQAVPDMLLPTCIPWATFRLFSQKLNNVRLITFVDACRSAGFAGNDQVARVLFEPNQGITFAACGARQVAREQSDWGHGAFTLALLEAVGNRRIFSQEWPPRILPDADGNKTIDLEELAKFVRTRVAQLTGDNQLPDYTKPRMGIQSELFQVLP